jgi:hypothetical protein
MKNNAVCKVVSRREVPKNRNILSDEIIQMTGINTSKKYPGRLRRIIVWDKENKKEIVLLTNHLEFGTTTISSIYIILDNSEYI